MDIYTAINILETYWNNSTNVDRKTMKISWAALTLALPVFDGGRGIDVGNLECSDIFYTTRGFECVGPFVFVSYWSDLVNGWCFWIGPHQTSRLFSEFAFLHSSSYKSMIATTLFYNYKAWCNYFLFWWFLLYQTSIKRINLFCWSIYALHICCDV